MTPQTAAHQVPPSLEFSGKNTGVGCHFLLQCMKVKHESEVAQSCPTLCNPMDGSPPGSSIHGIFRARVLEWGTIAFSDLLQWLSSNPGNGVKKRESSYTVGENINWCSHYGKQYVGSSKKLKIETSLVVQWLRIHLAMQGTQARSLVQEDPTC